MPIKIPYSFIKERLELSWPDMLWAYKKGLVGSEAAVDLAIDHLCNDSDDPIEIELAGISRNSLLEAEELLIRLAAKFPNEEEDVSKRRWLYLLLSYIFENRTEYSDPLGEVEGIYADFDYPEDIESFVRYMPTSGDYNPGEHTHEENENRLLSNWREYLETMAERFSIP